MKHIRSSVDGIFFLEHNTSPIGITQTDFFEPIKHGSLCVDLSTDLLYILKNGIGWVLIEGAISGTSGSTVLGPARNGTYLDGLFPFSPSTPVGYAVDDINELLVALVPPSAPILSDWTGNVANDVNGKLSFDTLNPIGGYTPADSIGITNPKSVDDLWSINGKRLGIHDATSDNITGVLNEQVTANPNNAYNENTFGDANKGVLNLILNNVLIDTLDLTSSSSGISSLNITVSSMMPSLFPTGAKFNDFINRTGSWSLSVTHPNAVLGYNYVVLEHDLGFEQRLLDRYDFIIDGNITNTSFSGESLNSLVMSGTKYLSGIQYHTGGQANYDIIISNLYRNTYYSDGDAITHQGNSNSYGLLLTAPQQALTPCGGNENQQVIISGKTATIINSGKRLIKGSISLNTTAKRTVQGSNSTTLNQPANTINNILLDNISSSSTDTIEDFNDEQKRLVSNLTYNTITEVSTTGTWNSQNWLLTPGINGASIGYEDGLQIIDGKLVYPTVDFTTTNITNGPTFNDGGTLGGARDYSTATGNRSYLRYFRQVSPTTANFIINIAGSGGTFVNKSTSLTGNNIHLEMKAPTETGWLDCYNDFSTGQFNDGDGARSSSNGVGRLFNTNWGLTIGTKSTANTNGYIIIKITVGSTFNGEFTGISFSFD